MKEKINKIIEIIKTTPAIAGKYGNGDPCTYQRIVQDNLEYTLVDGYLYMGEVGSTVTRIDEGKRTDSLLINGEKAKFASLIVKGIDNGEIFYTI